MLRGNLTLILQGRKLTFLGRRQLVTDLFFSVAKWENVGDQLWNSGRQCKIFSRIADQESAISDPALVIQLVWYILSVKVVDIYLHFGK